MVRVPGDVGVFGVKFTGLGLRGSVWGSSPAEAPTISNPPPP